MEIIINNLLVKILVRNKLMQIEEMHKKALGQKPKKAKRSQQ
jgi:hypothetical protein